jgi:hypothetical protein
MVNAMEAQSHSGPTGLSAEELSDLYAEFASTAAAFPTEHHAAMAGALARSENEAVREAALGLRLATVWLLDKLETFLHYLPRNSPNSLLAGK